MYKKILVLVIAGSPFLGNAQAQKFKINGKMIPDTPATGKIYLSYNDNGEEMRDSSDIVNGRYKFKRVMKDGAIRAFLYWEDRTKGPVRSSKGSAQFYVNPGTTKIKHGKAFHNYTVSGAKLEEQYSKFLNQYGRNKSVDKNAQLDFIKNNPDSWLSYVFLDFRMNRARDISYDKADSLYATLSPRLQKFERVQEIKTRIEQTRLAIVGNQAIDFTANDINGNPISLSSYRGRYVFLDFWASWCSPCRAENPAVTAAYQKFKDKGLNILAVSLDGNREAWLKAVKEDNLDWPQVSNLKAFKDEVAVKYGISAIPANFLIDPSGKIIAKNLHGEQLEKTFAEVFR